MSFVSNKQQKLIDESTANFVKYYDKITAQYLKLRQDIFQLSTISDEITPEAKTEYQIKLDQLRFELDKTVEAYKTHVNETLNHLKIRATFEPPYVKNLNAQFEELSTKMGTIKQEIARIKDVQKPILDKMKLLAKSFELNSGARYAKAVNPKTLSPEYDSTTSNQVDFNSLMFKYEDIAKLFENVNLNLNDSIDDASDRKDLNEHIQNLKVLESIGDDTYYYKLGKSSLHKMDRNTTLEDYDKAIDQTVSTIKGLLSEGAKSKESWSNNANKLETIRDVLMEIDTL